MKMWCRNNLIAVGKWGGPNFLFGVVIVVFVFVPTASLSMILNSFGIGRINFSAHAYFYSDEIPSSRSYPSSESKLELNPMDGINKLNDITLPINNLISDTIKGLRFNQNLNIGTGIPVSPIKSPSVNIDFNRFFSSSTVSSNDLTSFLKEATVTGINLTILIISITSQVLKGLLEAIK